VTRADAGEWAAQMLGRPGRGRVCRMLVHTIVWQYMPSETQKRVAAAIDSAAAAATEETPFAHFAFEPDGADGTGRMTLTIWPGGRTETLGRAHFHGRFAHWA
jgi:hypothetical protein